MRSALVNGIWVLGLACAALPACNKTNDRNVQSRPHEPTAAERRRIEERKAEERRAEDRLADERRAEERRAEERRAEERRAEERKEEIRAEDRKDARTARSVGGGPNDPVLRATAASALTNLASVRCDREVRCKNVGAKEKYKTRADCVAEMQRDKRDDLNSDVCPGGVREKELNDCLTAIREESCGNPLDTLTRLNACRSGNLCAK